MSVIFQSETNLVEIYFVNETKELSLQREVEVLSKAKEEVEKHVNELVRKIGEFEEKVKKAKSLQSQEVKVSIRNSKLFRPHVRN